MQSLVNLNVDHEAIERIILDNIQTHLANVDNNKLFYTMSDLQEITGMSKGFIEQRFFMIHALKKSDEKSEENGCFRWLKPDIF